MFRFFPSAVFSVLLFCLMVCPAYGVVLSYNETFDDSIGSWTAGYLTPNYPLWHVDAHYNSGGTRPNIRMGDSGAAAGTMTLATTTGDAIYAMIASSCVPAKFSAKTK